MADLSSTSAIAKLNFELDQCKFYPLDRRGVFAGTIKSIEIDVVGSEDDHEKFRVTQPGDRCLVYYSEEDANETAESLDNRNESNAIPSPLTIASLMQQWSANETGNQKCTKWIRLVVPQPVCCHFGATQTTPFQKQMKHRKLRIHNVIDSSRRNNESLSVEPRPCWIFEKCVRIQSQEDDRQTNHLPSTFELRLALEQSKFYSTKLMVLDGTVMESKPSVIRQGTLVPDLIKGERCRVHVRSNLKSLLPKLQGGNGTTFVNQEYDSTGWVQFTTPLQVACRILILPSYSNNGMAVQVPRNAKKEGTAMLECQEVLEIQQDQTLVNDKEGSNTVWRLGSRSFKKSGFHNENKDNRQNAHPLPALRDRQERHGVFAKWLVDKFGVSFLSTGSGVLDVAGGKGELCKALFDLGVRKATLLDPDPRCNPKVVPFQVIGKALQGDASDLIGGNSDSDCDKQDNERVRSLILNCSLIAGMHPDGATEAIVDTSLRLGVPFAILPCCYSRKIFDKPPLDTNENGQNDILGSTSNFVDPHQSYSIFCQYLLERAPVGMRFQTEHLPFQGRNKVIYFESYSCQVTSQQ
jgi:hypothetical protein